jgi:hypothetical protein
MVYEQTGSATMSEPAALVRIHPQRLPGDRDVTLQSLQEALQRTRAMIDHVRTLPDAALLVRHSGAASKLVHEALKTFRALEQEQFELKQAAAETHLRTQRRAGELLSELAKHPGGRSATASVVEGVRRKPATLRELRITPQESHRWQRIAMIPNDRFDAFIAASRQRGKELTVSAAVALAKQILSEPSDDGGHPAAVGAKAAQLAEFTRVRPYISRVISLDAAALASVMSPAERRNALDELARWRLWATEFNISLLRTA